VLGGAGRATAARRLRSLAACLLLGTFGTTLAGAAPAARADAVRNQELWVLKAIHVPAAWRVTRGRGVTVAVIDSGVDASVSDLAGSVEAGPNYSGVRTPASNASWGVHGTWMASLVAGHGHAGGSSGIIGVAPQSRVLSIRVVTDQGDPGFARYQRERASRVQQALARAIRFATRHRVAVISMSLGYAAASLPVRSAIQYALDSGVVVVASSGNSGGSPSTRRQRQAPYSFPADYPGVLGVGAVGRHGRAARFSSDNLSVQVAAPGVQVPAQGRNGHYWLVSGTSPACALTAGVAALIKARYPGLAPALVDQAITASAQHRPPGGYDVEVGFGTVDATAALALAARLSRDTGAGEGVSAGAHFRGTGAIPPVPVPPRGSQRLALYALLAVAALALVLGSAWRLVAVRGRAATGTGDRGREVVPEWRPGEPPPGPGPAGPMPGAW
jgi:subtilisin family serine protease